MPQRCIETQSSDSPLVGGAVKVSRDTSLFKWVPHGESTYYQAVWVKVDLRMDPYNSSFSTQCKSHFYTDWSSISSN